MQEIIDFLKTDTYLLVSAVAIIILFIGLVILLITNIKVKKQYKKFMQKIGNGSNIEEDLKKYIEEVEQVKKQNGEIMLLYDNMKLNLKSCLQKTGMVRYNAFKDVGSDLSFALALLDEKNDGVVLNGIYSRDVSNIYAKPIKNGVSTYTLSHEEEEAVDKAVKYDYKE